MVNKENNIKAEVKQGEKMNDFYHLTYKIRNAVNQLTLYPVRHLCDIINTWIVEVDLKISATHETVTLDPQSQVKVNI